MTWDTAALGLDAYLDRIGATAVEPSLAALTDLLQAHALTFPFENIDVLLGQHRGVDLATVQEKFVGRGRGGYCFEHATLFHAVLTQLGYDVEPHLGRVGSPETAARTHLVMVVTLDGRRYLSDPGIGVPPLVPVPLIDGDEVQSPLWPHRLVRVSESRAGDGWELQRQRTTEWESMHWVDELPVRRVDVEAGHHWTSTGPTNFLSSFICNRFTDDDGLTIQTMNTDTVTVGRAGQLPEARPYDVSELPELLARVGTHLSDAETAGLAAKITEFREGARTLG